MPFKNYFLVFKTKYNENIFLFFLFYKVMQITDRGRIIL